MQGCTDLKAVVFLLLGHTPSNIPKQAVVAGLYKNSGSGGRYEIDGVIVIGYDQER